MEVLKNFVGGNPVVAEVEEELGVPDPATGELLGRVPLSGREYIDKVVRAAEAFEEWCEESVTSEAQRGRVLHREEGGAHTLIDGSMPEKAAVGVGLLQ